MAKKSMIARELKRQKLVKKYNNYREKLKIEAKLVLSFEDLLLVHRKLQKLPRNSSPSRLHNRCWKTGRPRSYYRFFGLSRHVLREMAHDGLLPGVIKASW